MIQHAWVLCAASTLASLSVAAPSDAVQPTRNFVVTGELLFYSPANSGLPLGTMTAMRGARSDRDVYLNVECLSLASDDFQTFNSGPLVHANVPLVMGEAADAPLVIGDLSLHREKSGWTFYAESDELKGRPVFTMTPEAASLQRISENDFVLSGEIELHEAMAAELGLRGATLPPSLAVGTLTIRAASYPGLASFIPAPSVKWIPTVASSALSVAGPDVVVSSIGGSGADFFDRKGTVGTITGYAVRTVSCNIGTQDAEWFDTIAPTNRHPVIGTQFYRLKTVSGASRFEQIGMSWLKHGFCAADAPNCGAPYVPNGSCDWLGLFATDTYGAGLNAQQSNCGPRSEIQPWTGVYPYPYVLQAGASGNAIFKRCQVENADIDPTLNAGASYVTEVVYICTDEPDANKYNNYSTRAMSVAGASPTFTLSNTGSTNWQECAVERWKVLDPTITIVSVDVPGDGRFWVGAKVTSLGGNQWHYEYAVQNMNCNDSARQIKVPADATVTTSNVGFHDVPYHSGEPYDGTDWANARTSTNVEWSTSTFLANANANALRWSTTYNFRFDANIAPVSGNVEIGLFRSAGTATAVGLPVPDSFGFPVSYCFGDGTGTACPCGNVGAAGNGCGNAAFSGGGRLGYSGLASISLDTLVLSATTVTPFGPGLYFQGSASIPAGSVFGNGLLCLTGSTPRLEIRVADGSGASATTVPIHTLGSALAGDVRNYQMWYRDGAAFCTLAGFNLTNALNLTWAP